jgi:hypothetical protein
MIKCFLSHSRKDKESYVRIVAEKLGAQNAVYDEFTFEEGMNPLEEIIKGLDSSQLFVLFLSNSSIESEWVKREISEAKKRLSVGMLQRIYPLIIDSEITYQDQRIPSWMRDEYNLKLVTRPTVAARRIRQRLREISWQFHPKLRQREKIFVGRNEQIREFEERIDDFDLPKPICITASGMEQIGRRSFLRHALVKANFMSDSYRPPVFSLARHESIEDLILKLYDLGMSKAYSLTYLLEKTVDEKIELCVNILKDIQKAKEIIFIVDNGCLVNYNRDFENWFRDIIIKLAGTGYFTAAIASSWRPLWRNVNNIPYIYVINLPELNIKERKGLFKRYIEFEGINLTSDDFNFFSDLLYGYPEQVIFTVDLIKDFGVKGAKKASHQIQEYNAEKASIAIQKYQTDPNALEFIYLLSEFEVISLDFLYEIADERRYSPILKDLMARAIVDSVGVEQEFIRLNDSVRDYIRRNRFGIPDQFKEKLKLHVKEFIETTNKFDRDISDYQYSIKTALLEGKEIQSKYLIPSHFLSTMRELYQQRKHYDRVIELADIILQKRSSLEYTIRNDIQYYLCLALARKKSKRFLSEVQQIHGPEHNFLLGFYYRLLRRDADALVQLEKALESKVTAIRARRELVQVYLYTEQYALAIDLARKNYEDNRDNPYQIQAYYNCLINLDNPHQKSDEARKLIDELFSIGSEKAVEMAKIGEALWWAKCENNSTKSFNLIEDAILSYPKSPYPIITKFDIMLRFGEIEGMKITITEMEKIARSRAIYKETIARSKCFYLACIGERNKALKIINCDLQALPVNAKKQLAKKVDYLYANANP